MRETILRRSMIIFTYQLAHHACRPGSHPQRKGCTLRSWPGAHTALYSHPMDIPAHGPPCPWASSLALLYYHGQRLPRVAQAVATREDWTGSWASQHSVRVQMSVCSLWDCRCQGKGLRPSLQWVIHTSRAAY